MLKIRYSCNCLISVLEIPTSGKMIFILEQPIALWDTSASIVDQSFGNKLSQPKWPPLLEH